jgi:hypothetical protein
MNCAAALDQPNALGCHSRVQRGRADLATLPLETTGFELDQELTARMLARGQSIVEVPIRYYPRSRGEGKKIGARDWVIAVRTLVRYRGRR